MKLGIADEKKDKKVNSVVQNTNVGKVTEGLENLNVDTIQIFNVNRTNVHDKCKAYATLDIKLGQQPTTLKFKVDTEGNVLPLRIFRKMYPHKVDNPLRLR